MPLAQPNRFYVYAHRDRDGRIFYIGKGTDRRAWSRDRDRIWKRYVEERSGGTYTVEIIKDRLTQEAALSLEADLITRYREQLVNWGGELITLTLDLGPIFGDKPRVETEEEREVRERRRAINALAERYWSLRKESQAILDRAKEMQKADPVSALELAGKALHLVREYGAIRVPHHVSLVEELREHRKTGDPNAIYRLVQILKQLGRDQELVEAVDHYLEEFPDDEGHGRMRSVLKNRDAAAARLASHEHAG